MTMRILRPVTVEGHGWVHSGGLVLDSCGKVGGEGQVSGCQRARAELHCW